MNQSSVTKDSSGSELFPEYATLYDLIACEVEGLSDAQLDYTSERWEWNNWSIRTQLSHMAFRRVRPCERVDDDHVVCTAGTRHVALEPSSRYAGFAVQVVLHARPAGSQCTELYLVLQNDHHP